MRCVVALVILLPAVTAGVASAQAAADAASQAAAEEAERVRERAALQILIHGLLPPHSEPPAAARLRSLRLRSEDAAVLQFEMDRFARERQPFVAEGMAAARVQPPTEASRAQAAAPHSASSS